MSENEIRQILQKIKFINKKMVAYYFSEAYGADNDVTDISYINKTYTEHMKMLIGSINKVKSERILKAIGFEKYPNSKYLIPANAFDLIDDNTELISILDEVVIKGADDISMDTRNGMLAYYIKLEGIKK